MFKKYKCDFDNFNNGLCSVCNKNETVIHYIMLCSRYEKERYNLRKKLIEIDSFYNDFNNFRTLNLLFPHRWQSHPDSKDKEYKEKVYSLLKVRLRILREICKFVILTKRFDNEWKL